MFRSADTRKGGGGHIFTPLGLEAKSLFDAYFSRKRQESSDCTFAKLFIWRQAYSYEWALIDGSLWIKGRTPEQLFVLSPLGDTLDLSGALKTLDDYFTSQGFPLFIRGATIDIARLFSHNWPNRFVFSPDRNSYDYVYRSFDLVNLLGRKDRSQRNYLNRFRRVHPDAVFVPITPELIPQLISSMETWYPSGDEWQPAMPSEEKRALEEALVYCSELELAGGALLVNDKAEAFAVGEDLNEDTFVVHMERANPRIKGIYQAVNREFCKTHCAGKQYVNGEKDMGIAGIRTVKTSYQPVRYVPKINIIARTKLP